MTTKTVLAYVTKKGEEVYGYAVSIDGGHNYLHHVREEGEPTDHDGILETLKGIPLPHEIICMLAGQTEDDLQLRHGDDLTIQGIGSFEADVDDE
ncbi:hypothetical protein forsur_31 [Escherichia phage forsur]|uniref:Uncharacterized protein n=1 Tax=Escherichia phage usur TaxID=2696459 RepID=A0A6B9X7B7_9CAUD|nr:hypothetical protein forsur_31 [Escherichia phage forsur]QHR72976.1 hypothetical protein usur_49 [Escherichia phage usur]